MKKTLFAVLVLILAGTAQADVELEDGSILMKYFSEVERTQFFAEQLHLAEQLGKDGRTRAEDKSNTTVTIQVHGAPIDESGLTAGAAAEAYDYVGYITCNVSQHYPHATYYNGVPVVKAKSSGGCDYVHTAGTPPPTITWTLQQILAGSYDVGMAHIRTGHHPLWSDSSAFIVTPCSNGMWIHGDFMFVTLPAGWYFGNGASTVYWLMGTVGQQITC